MIARLQEEAAFTLLETLVSVSILALLSASMAPAFHNQAKTNTDMERRTAAVEAAQLVLDNLRFEDPSSLPATGAGSAQQITVAGYAFAVTPSYCGDTSLCPSNNTRHISVAVDYEGSQIYEIQTVYTKLR